jgi:hypothetical protein
MFRFYRTKWQKSVDEVGAGVESCGCGVGCWLLLMAVAHRWSSWDSPLGKAPAKRLDTPQYSGGSPGQQTTVHHYLTNSNFKTHVELGRKVRKMNYNTVPLLRLWFLCMP